MQITQISQAKKNPEHVNIFLDEKYWVNISKNLLVELSLAKGTEIDEKTKKEIEEKAARDKIIEKVFNFIAIRPRSVSEIRTYLIHRRALPEEQAENIVNLFIEKGFLSDQSFAEWYVENRLATGAHGVNKIKAELAKKGVKPSIVNQLFQERQQDTNYAETEIEKIKEFIDKVSPKIKAKDQYEHKQKLIQRLMGRGYDYSLISKAMQK